MEGPFRANLHEGAFSIPFSFREIEIKCRIVASRHLGPQRNTQPITSSETVMGRGWHTSTTKTRQVAARRPNCSPRTKRGGSRRTLRGCQSFCASKLAALLPNELATCNEDWRISLLPQKIVKGRRLESGCGRPRDWLIQESSLFGFQFQHWMPVVLVISFS
jgi:hypothetical protein